MPRTKGVTLRHPNKSTLKLGARFRGKNARSAISALKKFKKRFPGIKVGIPRSF